MGASVETVVAIDDHGRKVQSMFSEIAHGYDRANRVMSLGADVRWRRKAVRMLADINGKPPGQVLDLCAGTLDSSKEIHAAFPKAAILGGDFSQGMLDAGARTLNAEQQRAIQPVALDAHSLPVADASQDALFCAFGVRNLSDLHQATREQARVVRPGGRLVILDFFRPQQLHTRTIHAIYNSTVLPTVGFLMTGNLGAYVYLPRSIGKFCTTQDYATMLAGLGFVNVQIQNLTLGMASIVSAYRTSDTQV